MITKPWQQIPIYVTRDTIDGLRGQIWFNVCLVVLIQILFAVNAVGWGAYGVYSLARMVI